MLVKNSSMEMKSLKRASNLSGSDFPLFLNNFVFWLHETFRFFFWFSVKIPKNLRHVAEQEKKGNLLLKIKPQF